jgi:hypothetical protein
MAIAPTTTLAAIETKVRRLTRSLSESQLTTADLDNYINTAVVYDFPEHIRMFNLRTTFTFYTNPYQDVYPTDKISFSGVTTNPLYDFQNKYLTVHPPFFIAGYNSYFTQSREQFYGIYPIVNSIASIGVAGDGVVTVFSGVINSQQAFIPASLSQTTIGLLQNNVLFSSVAVNGAGLAMVDYPVVDTTTGNPSIIGNLYTPANKPTVPPTVVDANNFVNYATGQFKVTFPSAPGSGAAINSQTVPQNISLPQGVCYYDNQFIVRPVPDQPYAVNFEAYVSPVYLMDTNQSPELNEWWQYIAYLSAKKIFEDRMDMESVQAIMPELRKQECMCLRRTIVQQTNERTATIYSQNDGGVTTPNGWGYGGGLF